MENLKETLRCLVLRQKGQTARMLYESLPLTNPESFRLLTLLPSTEFSSSIQCTLSVANFQTASYQALSYCWDNPKITRPIKVNNIRFYATKNLVSALRHIRRESNSLVIWVDAICINQNDLREREAQVQQMGSIYSQAGLVVCWLGEARDDSHLAIQTMKAWGDAMASGGFTNPRRSLRMNEMSLHVNEILGLVKGMDNPLHPSAWRAITLLFERAWWFRVWILQEFILGKDVILQCGHDQLAWRHLSVARLLHLVDPLGTFGSNSTLNARVSSMYIQRVVFHAFEGRPAGLGRKQLIYTIREASTRHATDPRDTVFGVLGLMEKFPRYLIQVDYSLSMEDTYIMVAKGFMLLAPHTECCPMLSVLSHAGTCHQEPAALGTLPSWVPEWNALKPTLFMLLSSAYSATRGSLPTLPWYSQSGKIANIKGVTLDSVVVKIEEASHATTRPWHACEEQKLDALLDEASYPTGVSRLEALFKTITCDIGRNGCRYKEDLETAYAYIVAFLVQIARAKLGPKVNESMILERIRHQKDLPAEAGLGSFFSPKGFPPFPKDYDFEQGLELESQLRVKKDGGNPYTRNRCYFKTANKYLGLGPMNMKGGELICILFGSPVPHVLREDNGQYILIGEAYIDGFMDGEAMAQIRSGDLVQQEFAIK